eukprot:COSAG01_NODE_4930_length_4614_cov_2.538206_3_plen_101_part_00
MSGLGTEQRALVQEVKRRLLMHQQRQRGRRQQEEGSPADSHAQTAGMSAAQTPQLPDALRPLTAFQPEKMDGLSSATRQAESWSEGRCGVRCVLLGGRFD